MSKERDLLESCLDEFQYHEVPCSDLIRTIQWLLNEPEQTKRSPLTEAEISKTLKLSRRSTEWDYGFEAGVGFAEEFHGIGEDINKLLAQPEQEPVEDRIARWHKLGYEQGRKSLKREPLSDEAVLNLVVQYSSRNELARAIEKAHGVE